MQTKKSVLATIAATLLVAAASHALPLIVASNGSTVRGTGIPAGNLFDQSNACNPTGPASQRFPDFANAVLQSADDFTVPAGLEWDITTVNAAGIFFGANPNNGPISAVEVQIWSAAGNLPATQLCAESGTNELADPDMSLTLSGACAAIMPLGEGQYFVSMMAVMPFAPSGQWAWGSNNSTNGAEFAFQDPDALLGAGPCNTWGAGGTTCGIAAGANDMCFSMDGTEAAGGLPVVTVPTLDQVGFFALFAALAALGIGWIRFHRG